MPAHKPTGVFDVLSFLGYSGAAVLLVGGLLFTVALVGVANDLPATVTSWHGLGPLLRPLIGPLHTAVELVAVFVFVATVLSSILLFITGRLLAAVGALTHRVDRLERARWPSTADVALTPRRGSG